VVGAVVGTGEGKLADKPLGGEKSLGSDGEASDRARWRPRLWSRSRAVRRRVGLPADLRLRVIVMPVVWLWERLSGWQQDQVEAAAKAELVRLTNVGVTREGAPRVLADRLAETGGEAMVTGPYWWLIRRGLPQR
jgi:hypothetical protein